MKLTLRMAAFLIACGNRGFIPPTWPIVLNLSLQVFQMLSHTLIHSSFITILWGKQSNYDCASVTDSSFHSTLCIMLMSLFLVHSDIIIFAFFFPSFFTFFASFLDWFLAFFLSKACFLAKVTGRYLQCLPCCLDSNFNTFLVGTHFMLIAWMFSNHAWVTREMMRHGAIGKCYHIWSKHTM